jgi:transcriptional regulator with XRE-family HTH domain
VAHKSFATFLRAHREKAGLTVRQLADRLHTSHTYLLRLESGDQGNPSAEFLTRLAAVLELDDASELFTLFGVEPSRTLPAAPIYFRRKYGLGAGDARELAKLVDDFRRTRAGTNNDKEVQHDKGTSNAQRAG